jgi:hypothetical protein
MARDECDLVFEVSVEVERAAHREVERTLMTFGGEHRARCIEAHCLRATSSPRSDAAIGSFDLEREWRGEERMPRVRERELRRER